MKISILMSNLINFRMARNKSCMKQINIFFSWNIFITDKEQDKLFIYLHWQ